MNNIFKDPHKVWKITTLKNKIRQDEAKQILAKVAKLVQPIMRRHNWRVKLLAEYCPKDPSIRGENVGGERLEIHLRIRRPNSEMDFFAFDQILDNMLHELCHYNRGPHDEKFYDLLDQVRRECNELLLDKGKGVRLNGNPRKSSLFSFIPSGPKHLGRNSTVMTSLRPKEAAAMAAERRLRVDLWCGTNSVSDSVQHSNGTFQLVMDRSKLVLKVLVWVMLFEIVWQSYKYLFW